MNHELNGKNGNVIIYNLRIDRYAENMIETENILYQMFLIKTRGIVILARVFFAPKFNWHCTNENADGCSHFFAFFHQVQHLSILRIFYMRFFGIFYIGLGN